MGVALMRSALRELHDVARDAHAGLLLQRGLAEVARQAPDRHDDEEANAKTKHVNAICRATGGDFYKNAFARWRKSTEDAQRFRQVILALESRLFIGMAGGGALETGCAISHTYGMPYIPGSSVKGIVSAHAREHLPGKEGHVAREELFGSEPNARHTSGLAGLISFHDAWWMPNAAESPFVQEVVTTHHVEYYSGDGRQPATDFDSPVLNAQIAVQGSFLFVMEGPCAWLGLAEEMLKDALHERGIGAKTRAGYGFFVREAVKESRPTCSWVDEKIAAISQAQPPTPPDVVLRGRQLARAFDELEDSNLKREAFEDIRARWVDEGWWDEPPPGKATRDARAIYAKYAEGN